MPSQASVLWSEPFLPRSPGQPSVGPPGSEEWPLPCHAQRTQAQHSGKHSQPPVHGSDPGQPLLLAVPKRYLGIVPRYCLWPFLFRRLRSEAGFGLRLRPHPVRPRGSLLPHRPSPACLLGSHPTSHRRAGWGKVCGLQPLGKDLFGFGCMCLVFLCVFFLPSFGFKLGLTYSWEQDPAHSRGQALLCPDKPSPTPRPVPVPAPLQRPHLWRPPSQVPPHAGPGGWAGPSCKVWGVGGNAYEDAPAPSPTG